MRLPIPNLANPISVRIALTNEVTCSETSPMPIPGLSRNKVFRSCLCNGLEHGLPLITRSFAQLTAPRLDVTEDFIGRSRHVGSALSSNPHSSRRLRPSHQAWPISGCRYLCCWRRTCCRSDAALPPAPACAWEDARSGFQIEMALRPPVATVGRSVRISSGLVIGAG